jgi:hypothetical protein
MIDGEMPDWALGIVVRLRQLKGCWFVAQVLPREGDVPGEHRWVRRDDQFALVAKYSGSSTIGLEVGWGDVVYRESLRRGERVTFSTPDPDLPGHVLWVWPDSPTEWTSGEPLGPPS